MVVKYFFRLATSAWHPKTPVLFRSSKCTFVSTTNAFEQDSRPKQDDDVTHFGFQTMGKDEKREAVQSLFELVSERYDRMNDVQSFGIHRFWKDYFIRTLNPLPGSKLLDSCGGTGDISFRFLNYLKSRAILQHTVQREHGMANPDDLMSNDKSASQSSNGNKMKYEFPESHAVVFDFTEGMMEAGKKRASDQGFTDRDISWIKGNAEELPFQDNLFDAYTIVFGIRNVVNQNKLLREAYRVLKKGGRFLCMELSHVENPVFRYIYDTYSFQMVPILGQLIVGDPKPYQYLVESIRMFPKQEEFSNMVRDAGFCEVSYENLTFGVVAIHSGFKL